MTNSPLTPPSSAGLLDSLAEMAEGIRRDVAESPETNYLTVLVAVLVLFVITLIADAYVLWKSGQLAQPDQSGRARTAPPNPPARPITPPGSPPGNPQIDTLAARRDELLHALLQPCADARASAPGHASPARPSDEQREAASGPRATVPVIHIMPVAAAEKRVMPAILAPAPYPEMDRPVFRAAPDPPKIFPAYRRRVFSCPFRSDIATNKTCARSRNRRVRPPAPRRTPVRHRPRSYRDGSAAP
jgi:hypothetical protein